MKRRTFIGTSVAAAAAFAARPSWAAESSHQIKKVGLQLYTVRGEIKKDFDGTIAKVAATGYKEVELFGGEYGGHSPKEIRALLEKNGLVAPSAHIDYVTIENKWPETLDAAHIMGNEYLVCPWIDEKQRTEPDVYKRATDLFNKAGETTKKAGIQFCFHNHFWEFEPDANLGGKFAYDYMLENSDANNLKMELDLCWISVAGQDPLAYFKKYPGRFPLVHVKDVKKLPKLPPDQLSTLKMDTVTSQMTSVGSGVIDWKRIFAKSDEAGIKHYFVEQDQAADQLATLQASYTYLSTLRF